MSHDSDLTDIIGSVLRIGVLLSSVSLVAGLALLVISPPEQASTSLGAMLALGFGKPSLDGSGLLSGLSSGNGIDFLELGMLILIATPLARVVASIALFSREKDATYVGITLLVLVMLLVAIFAIGPFEG